MVTDNSCLHPTGVERSALTKTSIGKTPAKASSTTLNGARASQTQNGSSSTANQNGTRQTATKPSANPQSASKASLQGSKAIKKAPEKPSVKSVAKTPIRVQASGEIQEAARDTTNDDFPMVSMSFKVNCDAQVQTPMRRDQQQLQLRVSFD